MLFSYLRKTGLCLLALVLASPAFSLSPPYSSSSSCGASSSKTVSSAVSNTASSSPALSCQVNETSRWASGYQVEVKVSNPGTKAVTNWSVILDVPPGDSFLFAWNAATLSHTNGSYTIGNLTWNKEIPAKGSVSFGANLNGKLTPTCRVTGQTSNNEPVADFTAKVTDDTVHFESTATDPDGDKLTTTFDFGDGKSLQYKDVWHSYKTPGSYTVTQTVSDGKLTKTVIRTVVVGAAGTNHAPSAIFSYYTSGLRVPVNAKASADIDGDPLTYSWDFGSGATTASTNPSSSGYVENGGGYVTLTVFDGKLGNTRQVWAPGNPCLTTDPAPNLTINSVIDNLKLSLDASESGNADSFTWDFGDGTTGTGMFATHVYASAGTYTVTLKANGQMMSSTKSITVEVSGGATNLPPVAALKCQGGTKYVDDFINYVSTVTFEAWCDATASTDPEGASLSYTINWGDGSAAQSSSSGTFYHSYKTRGVTVPITLTVSDGVNVTKKILDFYTSEPVNKNPILVMNCIEVEVPATTTAKTYVTQCDASGSNDPEGQPLTYELQWGDNTTDQSSTGKFSHTYKHGGYYMLTLKASDGVSWDFKIEHWNVTGLENIPPDACFRVKTTPMVGTNTVEVSGECSTDSDDEDLTYFWDFGDGLTATGITANHTYALPGTYVITLHVGDGLTESTTTATFTYATAVKTSHCEFKITNEWNGGFTGWLRVYNNSTAPISDWSALATFAGASTVSSSWNGAVTGTNPYTVKGVAWNNTIKPGGFSEVGFMVWGNGAPNSVPSLAGASCQ